jgi:predicted nuclease of restriction endonuclease-like (RecB) superfamily
MATNTSFAPKEARKAAKALRKFWQSGTRSLDRLRRLQKQKPNPYCYGNKQDFLKREAVKEGYNYDTMKKAWRIALEYKENDVEKLCDYVQQSDARFGPTHLLRLLTVKNRQWRDILAEKAIKGRWGVTQLETAILRLHERRPEVGRKPRVPEDRAQIRLVLEGLCLKWRRWCEAAQPRLSKELREVVKKATQAVAAVKEAAAAKRGKPSAGKQRKA